MTELVGKLFDVHKLPFKVVVWVAVVSGALVFGPAGFRAKLNLAKFMETNGGWVGVIFIGSAALVAINSVGWLIGRARTNVAKATWKNNIGDVLARLDHAEKAVLREFFIQGKNMIQLPMDNPTVVGLEKKGLVSREGGQGFMTLAGAIFPYCIVKEVDPHLTYELIGLPAGEPTAQDRERLSRTRPDFMAEIEHHNWLRSRSI